MKTVELISIPVSDQENAKNFYVQKLGFNLVFEGSTPDGGKWIQIGLPGDRVTFSLVTGQMHANPGSLKGIIINTDDIKTDVSKLRQKGISASDIRDFPHGKISSFSDPDGNQWVLRE
jgi:predicted enzyme related to lactoylglutathione lyase